LADLTLQAGQADQDENVERGDETSSQDYS